MKGVAWKNTRLENDDFLYVLQVDEIKGVRQQNRLLKEVNGWVCTGNAYDPKSKTESLIFSRIFQTESDFHMYWKR